MTKNLMYAQLAKLEKKIAADEHGGILHRWLYGREVLKAKAGRKQLPDGMIDALVQAGERGGRKTISATEIRNRVRFAETYANDQQVNSIAVDLGSWRAIVDAGFPPVEDGLFDLDDQEPVAPDEWEQLSLLPGFKPTIKLHGHELKITDATVPDLIAYRDKFRHMHQSFGKTLDLIEATVDMILDGWDGSPETKAVDAYRRGTR